MPHSHAWILGSAIGVVIASVPTNHLDALTTPAAPRQVNRSRPLGPGECGRTDPTYIRLANETGGQPFFFSPSEIAQWAHVARETSQSDLLLWSHSTLDATSEEFDVPIDSAMRRVTFSLSVDTKGGSLDIFDPQGRTVVTGSDGVEDTTLNCGRIVTINAPAAGMWRLRPAGQGRFWLVAQGRSDLSFLSAEFVQMGGRPGHMGLFKIPALHPLAGIPAMLRVNISTGEMRSASFDLVSLRGDPIQTINVTSADGEFFGRVDLPTQPFRVRVKGLDAAGGPCQRVFPRLLRAETVEVVAANAIEELVSGTTTPLTFVVRNIGPTDRFDVTAIDDRQFISGFEPHDLTLATGDARTVTVWLRVPADTMAGTTISVTVVATSHTAADTSNGTSVEPTVNTRSSIR